jgi:two-component system, cell cycle sensor histidine kinase and response regulator CckA
MSTTNLPEYDPQVLLNSQPVIVTVIDPSTHQIVFQNDTGLQKFGNIMGERCYQAIAQCPAVCAFCRMPEAVTSGTVVSNEVALPDDKFLLVHWSKAETADGRTHVIETISDITERKHTEQALQQAHKMEAVGRLAGGIAHDFNNLMMVVMGHAERLLERPMDDAMKRELEMISQAGTRAAALTKKLLLFSRRQMFEPKVVSVNRAIVELQQMLRQLISEQIDMVMVLSPDAGHVHVDPVQLDQVLMNLVLNARDVMPDGGSLTIKTATVTVNDAFVRTHPGSRAGTYVTIAVSDTGCGMDASTRAHLFEPFFTTKERGKGTGLGLTTVYGIVKHSRGYIDVTSELGKGSCFTIYLPSFTAVTDQRPVTGESLSPPVQDTILVVDDEDAITRLIAAMLEDQGYRVVTAGDGAQALTQLRELHGTCRLIITDIVMPQTQFVTFAESLRAIQPETPILYMSAYGRVILEANGVGKTTPFLPKPFIPATLIEAVRELLRAPSPY